MCLTIPAKIKKIKGTTAEVIQGTKYNKINVSLLNNLNIGDWILYTNAWAIKKIDPTEAKEILDVLEFHQPSEQEKMSPKLLNILAKARNNQLTKDEIVYLLNLERKEELEFLYSEADVVRQLNLKDFFCIHGIIEFSNYCKNHCHYCGLRCDNKNLKRYRLSINEIINLAVEAVNEKGYKLLVLQSGEDIYYTEERLIRIIKAIKKRSRVFIFLSIGERNYKCYKNLKKAGAGGVLFRFETSNPKLYKKLHPKQSFKKRLEHLRWFKELCYFIATGSLIGLPNQTVEDLVDDILLLKKLNVPMVSSGPFIPCDNTPLARSQSGAVELNLKIIAIYRLLMPKVKIPVTSALETLDKINGKKKALLAGANSLMINLTPAKYREHYLIYPNKYYQTSNVWEKYGLFKGDASYKMLESKLKVVI